MDVTTDTEDEQNEPRVLQSLALLVLVTLVMVGGISIGLALLL